jgi:hypothetical protein
MLRRRNEIIRTELCRKVDVAVWEAREIRPDMTSNIHWVCPSETKSCVGEFTGQTHYRVTLDPLAELPEFGSTVRALKSCSSVLSFIHSASGDHPGRNTIGRARDRMSTQPSSVQPARIAVSQALKGTRIAHLCVERRFCTHRREKRKQRRAKWSPLELDQMRRLFRSLSALENVYHDPVERPAFIREREKWIPIESDAISTIFFRSNG